MNYDVIIIGAGAAGLFCAKNLYASGLKVAVLEKNSRVALKVLISGGGRCNFTNLSVSAREFQSANPHFCISALKQFPESEFINMIVAANIPFYEKKLGQLFCKRSSKDIVQFLLTQNSAEILTNCEILEIDWDFEKSLYIIKTTDQLFTCKNLVVATGGLSFPKLGVSDFGYKIAKKLGHKIIPTKPALVGMIHESFQELAGVSSSAKLTIPEYHLCDDLLFTHKGISGPLILKASLWWQEGQKLPILFEEPIPKRLVKYLNEQKMLTFQPQRLDSFHRAEVTKGGVSTDQISSKTMESKLQKNLFFIGEVIDVTGLLGGYNFQWAWSSAYVCALELKTRSN